MEPKIRNHFASLCSLYIKTYHPEDYKLLQKFAENNYIAGCRHYTLQTVWRKFQEIYKKEIDARVEEVVALVDSEENPEEYANNLDS